MAPMRRGLVHAIAWLLATGAAVTLTWWGVHTVMAGTAYDPPRALPLPVDGVRERDVSALDSSTRRPRSPSPEPSVSSATPSDPAGAEEGRTSPAAPAPTGSATGPAEPSGESTEPSAGSGSGSGPGSDSAAGSGQVKSYAVDGGRVVLELGDSSAELVSATPDAGWQVQAWTEEYWIRVTFTRDGREVSVFCTWHDSAPRVEFDDR
ncbi:hypothetical protein [Streptomyces sp. NPDC127033]|uniref:hypothetical protein n=1 Tax=Streptomyces sp. NPDC127033 TaxID=3347110 RepID=UPI0036589953